MIKECGYEILDGLVNEEEQDNFERLVTSNDFAWFLLNTSVDNNTFEKYKNNFPNIIESPQLTHIFYHLVNDIGEINSDFYQYAFNLFNPFSSSSSINASNPSSITLPRANFFHL